MKLKRSFLFLLSVFMIVLFTNMVEVKAMNTGFETNHFPTEEKNTFIANINILPIGKESAKKSITCFDVNNNRLIAIGQNTLDRKTICIYSSDGVFQYGYTFNCSGAFGVEWDEENLNIYFVRSGAIVSVTPTGEVLDVFEVQNTIDNNTHSNDVLYSTRRIIGDTTYLIRNDMGIFNWIAISYSQIITIDATGAECIIYDVNSTQFLNTVVLFIFILMFVSVAVALVIREFIKLKHGN